MTEIVTMLMASQPGTGFAGSRWLARWGRQSLLEHAVAAAQSWPVPLFAVVLGVDAERILEEVDMGDAAVLVDPEWQEGEAASLRAGLDFLQRSRDVEAVVLADAAMPTVPPDVPVELVAAHRMTDRLATVPKYRYARGRPLVLGRGLWARLLGMEGGATAESVLATHEQWVNEVWFDQLAPATIATPEDLTDLAPRR